MSKKMIIAGVAAGLLAAPGALMAEEAAPVAVTLDVPVLSSYVWRGQVLNDEAVLQPSLTVSKNGLTLNYWQNVALTDNTTGDEFEFTEHDISLSYAFSCPLTGAGVTLGVVNYDFPNQSIAGAEGNISLVNDTREAYLVYGFSDVLLAPTLSVYYDFKEADGFYGSLGISHSVELAKDLALGLGASLGASDSDWGSFYFGDTGDGLTDWSVSASLPVKIEGTAWTITPGVSYTALLGDASDAVDASGDSLYFGDTDAVVGSLKASYAF